MKNKRIIIIHDCQTMVHRSTLQGFNLDMRRLLTCRLSRTNSVVLYINVEKVNDISGIRWFWST